jgi:antitoxin VapB
MTIRTKTFRSGNSQAVRLPAEIAYGEDGLELEVTRHGDMITLRPASAKTMKELAQYLKSLPEISLDMTEFERGLPRSFVKIGFPELAKYDDDADIAEPKYTD